MVMSLKKYCSDEELAEMICMSRNTLYKRLASSEWKKTEVALISQMFSRTDINGSPTPYSEVEKLEIIYAFKNWNDNTLNHIAEQTQVSVYYVDKIINNYLKELKTNP